MARVKFAKTKKKTTLDHFANFLRELDVIAPNHDAVVVSGHACSYWINLYSKRAFPDEDVRATSGKDLDLQIAPRIINDHFVDREEFEPSYVYIKDMLFFLARKLLVRAPITPYAPHFIVRCGQVKVWSSVGRGAVYVDFFTHPFGWHPTHVEKWAITRHIEGADFKLMNPIQCLWNFILAAAVLNQREGDRVKRFRKDHRRTKLLIPVVKEFLIDLQEGSHYEDSPRLLKGCIDDLKLIRKNKLTRKVEREIPFRLEDCLPEGITLD